MILTAKEVDALANAVPARYRALVLLRFDPDEIRDWLNTHTHEVRA